MISKFTFSKLLKGLRNNWLTFAFFIIILFSLPFRLYKFTYPLLDAFHFRQTQTATFTLNFYKHGINLLQTELDIFGIGRERFLLLEFPLYEAIVATLYNIFFVSEAWGRLTSIFAGFIGSWYLLRLVDLVAGKKQVALLSAFFFLFTPINMFYQRAYLIEPTIIACLLSGTFYSCYWLKRKDSKSYFLALTLLTLGLIQKGLYGPFWLLAIVYYYIKNKGIEQINAKKFIFLISFPLFVLFFWQKHVNYVNTTNGHTFFTSSSREHLEWNFGLLSDRFSISMWDYRARQILNGLFLKPGVVLFLIGLITLRQFDRKGFFYVFLLSQLIYFITVFRIQSQNYYQLVITPSVAPFLAVGLVYTAKVVTKIILFVKPLRTKRVIVEFAIVVIILFGYALRSWKSMLPSFYIDWKWYRDITAISASVPKKTYGIFATPGNEWNSVYTYYSGRVMKTVGVEEVSQSNINKWKEMGYKFLVLHEFQKYPEYLLRVKQSHSLEFLTDYTKVLENQSFKVYLFNET